MKAVEFESTISSRGEIAIPREIAGEIPAGEQTPSCGDVAAVWSRLGLAIGGAGEV